MRWHYGIGIDEYNRLFEKQGGCCAICGKHQSKIDKSLCVDHNHINEEIRGLLCPHCNWALGFFNVDKENEDLLLKAINYLRR